MRIFQEDKISVIITILILFLFVLSNLLFSQDSYEELSDVKVNFGNGFIIENFYQKDNLLFILMHRNYDLCVGIYDISDKNNPVELGRQEKNEYSGNPAYSEYLTWTDVLPGYFIRTNPQSAKADHFFTTHTSVAYQDTLIYQVRGYESTMKVYKIVNGTELELLKTVSILHKISEVKNVSVVNNVLFVSTRGSGLLLFDLTDHLNPVEKIILEKKDVIGHIAGGNKLLVGLEFMKMLVYDITDLWNPQLHETINYSHSEFYGEYNQNKFYVSGYYQTITLFDSSVIKINEINTKGYLQEIQVENNILIAGTNIGLEIFNASDPLDVKSITDYGASLARPVDFAKQNNFIYIANQGDGLKIVDVSDSANALIRGSLDTDGYALNLAVKDDYVYIADYVKGLQIINAANPDAPLLISSVAIPAVSDLDIIGDKLYLVTDNNELIVVNVFDKFNPLIEFRNVLSVPERLYTGEYKKIKAADSRIWISFIDKPLLVYSYLDGALTELYSSSDQYAMIPREFNYSKPYMFFSTGNGIQIYNSDELSLIKNYFGTNLATSIGSVSFDSMNKILYVIRIHFGSFGIVTYDLNDPENPVRTGDYFELSPGLENIAEGIIYEDGLLYVLTQNGIKILKPLKTVQVPVDNKITDYNLEQNYPNPFNPATTITYSIPENSKVEIRVFDIIGREVAVLVNEEKPAGEYTVNFDASHLSSGAYIYKLSAGHFTQSRKLVLLK